MTQQPFELRLWKAIAAVASGIMTSLLYDLVAQTSYVIQQEGTTYRIVPDGNNTKYTIFAAVSILLLFFFLWFLFIMLIHIASKFSRLLRFKKVNRVNGNILVNVFDTAKTQALDLLGVFQNENSILSRADYVFLYCRDLSIIIASLHAKFYQCKWHKKIRIENCFRHPQFSSIININQGISKYEYLALIKLLNNLLNIVTSYAVQDDLLKHDCQQMSRMLHDLNDIADLLE